MGGSIAKSNKIWIVGIAGLILGFFISIAEPDLHILAGQVDFVTSGIISKLSIVIVVSIGIAVMLTLGLFRIVYDFPLYIEKLSIISMEIVLALLPFKYIL